jgi:N-acetylglucosaminyl-diphospho-decaprenol L-rhamnosyltransferase
VHICVVVVTYNSSADLTGLVPTLSVEPKSGLRTTVVVVDNGSTDDTVAVARGSDDVDIVIEAENRGYAAGVNAGAAAVGEFDALLVLNPDIRVHEGALEAMSLALSGDVGVVAPRLVGADGTLQWSLRREPTAARIWTTALVGGARAARIRDLGDMYREPADYARPRDVDWATGAALLISRRCWDEVGPWDESFFLYSEETDFDLRARDEGYRLVYVPDAVIDHDCGDMRASPWLWSLRSVNRVVLHRRRHGAVRGGVFWIAAVLNEALRAGRSPIHRAALRALVRYARTGSNGAPIPTS